MAHTDIPTYNTSQFHDIQVHVTFHFSLPFNFEFENKAQNLAK